TNNLAPAIHYVPSTAADPRINRRSNRKGIYLAHSPNLLTCAKGKKGKGRVVSYIGVRFHTPFSMAEDRTRCHVWPSAAGMYAGFACGEYNGLRSLMSIRGSPLLLHALESNSAPDTGPTSSGSGVSSTISMTGSDTMSEGGFGFIGGFRVGP